MKAREDGPDKPGVKSPSRATALALGLLIGVGASLLDTYRAKYAPPAAHAPLDGPTRPDSHAFRPHWRAVLTHTWTEFNKDQIPTVAAGVTFYALLALFPALGAFVSLYGLFGDVHQAARQILTLQGLLPAGAVTVLSDQVARLAQIDRGDLRLTFVAGLFLSLWSSNAGIRALLASLNIAYEEPEHRGFIRLNAVSLAFTAGAIVLAATAAGVMVAAPYMLEILGLGSVRGLSLLRWPALLLVVSGLLAGLYRYGPARQKRRSPWITLGGTVAAAGWMIMSLLFSWYAANFGHYDKVYGSFGAIIGFMTWIWLSIVVVLFGAELNSACETTDLKTPVTAKT